MIEPMLRCLVLVALLMLGLPTVAEAAPQFINAENQVDNNLAAASYPYGTVGQSWKVSLRVADPNPCLDNSEDSLGANIDNLGNDKNLAGSRYRILGRRPEQTEFQLLRDIPVTADQLTNQCSPSNYNDSDRQIIVEAPIELSAPETRQQIKVQFLPADGSPVLETTEAPLYPSFRQKFIWSPGPSRPRPVRKGYTTVRLFAAPEMIGMRAYFLFRPAGSESYRMSKTALLRARKGRAYIQFTHRVGKGHWGAYVCLDYQGRFPEMWVGSSCPTKPIAKSELERLFPFSTTGF